MSLWQRHNSFEKRRTKSSRIQYSSAEQEKDGFVSLYINLAKHNNGDIVFAGYSVKGLKGNVFKRACISENISQVILKKKWNCKKKQ